MLFAVKLSKSAVIVALLTGTPALNNEILMFPALKAELLLIKVSAGKYFAG